MQKILYVFLALCLLHTVNSACGDGTFATAPVPQDSKAECTICFPLCMTCASMGACDTYSDKVKGVDRSVTPNTPLCAGVGLANSVGYNKNNDSCDSCNVGCATCAFDYDLCTSCKEGWDFDRNAYACTRATLGLAAVVFALSALTLLVGVITCICACKL